MSFASKVEDVTGKIYGFFKDIGVSFVKDHGADLAKAVIAKAVTTVMGLQDVRDPVNRPLSGDQKFGYATSTIAAYAAKTGVTMLKDEVETTIQTAFGSTIGVGITDLIEAVVKKPKAVPAEPQAEAPAPPVSEATQLQADISKWKNQIETIKTEPESESKTKRLAVKSEKIAIATARLAELVGV